MYVLYVLCISCLQDTVPLKIPPQLSVLYVTEMNRGQGWATHSSPQFETSKKTTCNVQVKEQLDSFRCLCEANVFSYSSEMFDHSQFKSQECWSIL